MSFRVICQQSAAAWRPHCRQRSPFMARMHTVGMDQAVDECPSCGGDGRDRHLWQYMEAAGLNAQMNGARVLRLAPERRLDAQTPYGPLLEHTFELTDLPDAEFASLFFRQADHVRLFGEDIASHFHAAGFSGALHAPTELLAAANAAPAGIHPREPLFASNR